MMTWVYIAIFAYVLNAAAFVVDKYLLSSPILRPISYAFWVGILSLSVVVLLPLGVIHWVNFYYFFISFTSGAAFFFALLFLYKAVKKTDISVASTKVGVLGVIFTYIFSVLILKDYFSGMNIIAVGLMVAGILFIGKTSGRNIWISVSVAGILFGFSSVLLKFTFNQSAFLNGFFWTRVGLAAMAFIALIHPLARKEVFLSFKSSSHSSRIIFLSNKILAGTGFFLLYWAIKLGNVAVVNALLSVQFVFIFLLALIFRNKIPEIAENIKSRILLEKFIGIVLIGAGFVILFK